jgi:hypothetical protein
MKQKLFLLITAVFFAAHLFAQIKAIKPVTQKPVVTTPTAKGVEVSKINPPPLGDLQKAAINIVVGDDGKDATTKVGFILHDDNNKVAAYYGDDQGITGTSGSEYSPGQNVTLLTSLMASEFQSTYVPGPFGTAGHDEVTPRNSIFSDFTFSGGILELRIYTPYHEAWKIKSLSLSLYFENDSRSPHTMTWNNIALSNLETTKQLKFDKQFNVIQ